MPDELKKMLCYANLVQGYVKSVYKDDLDNNVTVPIIPESLHLKAHNFMSGLPDCIAQVYDDNDVNYFKEPITLLFNFKGSKYNAHWDTDKWTCRKVFECEQQL